MYDTRTYLRAYLPDNAVTDRFELCGKLPISGCCCETLHIFINFTKVYTNKCNLRDLTKATHQEIYVTVSRHDDMYSNNNNYVLN